MKIYTISAVCSVCGGDGEMPIQDAQYAWRGDVFRSHKDPRICASILRSKSHKK